MLNGRSQERNGKPCRVWVQRAGDVFGNGSSCLPPELHLLPLIQNPSSLKHQWPLRLPVVLVGLCQP